jgi:hypothetical protein
VERFIFHHPKLYRQLLVTCLAVMLVSGVHSVWAASNDRQPTRSLFDPPTATTASPVTAVPSPKPVAKPQGWEGVSQLPGRDGSGRPAVAAAAPSIPLGLGDTRSLGRALNAVEFGDQHWPALMALWNRESGWNPNARNRYSGACGIPQALPCSKIPDMSPQGQIEWGLKYIRQRYGNPSNAWQFWLSHHWY